MLCTMQQAFGRSSLLPRLLLLAEVACSSALAISQRQIDANTGAQDATAAAAFLAQRQATRTGSTTRLRRQDDRRPLEASGMFDRGGDAEMKINPYTGDGSHLEFRFADDMNPVAPFDRIASSQRVNSLTGGFKNAQYVPPYIYPDPFPGHRDSAAGHDKTYWAGNYWVPDMHGTAGIHAPEDKLPPRNYPNQAREDAVFFIPPQAREDRIPSNMARYIDQVADRARAPDMVPCKAGDTVEMLIGNIAIPSAKLVGPSAEHMQAAIVDFADEKGSEDCTGVGCTVLNPCVNAEKGTCVGFTTSSTRDAGPEQTLRMKAACPTGYKQCKSFKMTVAAAALQREGKECNLVNPTTTPEPQPPTTPPDETLPEPELKEG